MGRREGLVNTFNVYIFCFALLLYYNQIERVSLRGARIEMFTKHFVDANLVFNFHLEYCVHYLRCIRCLYETGNVDIYKRSHQILTIETVHDATMSWNDITKIFDAKRSLEAAGKKTTEWTDNRTKQ